MSPPGVPGRLELFPPPPVLVDKFNAARQPVEKSTTVRHTHTQIYSETHSCIRKNEVLQIYLRLTLPGSVDRERRYMRQGGFLMDDLFGNKPKIQCVKMHVIRQLGQQHVQGRAANKTIKLQKLSIKGI